MNKKILSSAAVLIVGSLLLAGCSTSDQGEPSGGETNGGTDIVNAGPTYVEKWDERRPEDLLFPRGEYAFTYRENNKESALASWGGEGVIGFYEDGTCAFDFKGTRTDLDGTETTYQLGKYAVDSPFVHTDGTGFWNNDQLFIEAEYRTNFPSMGAFSRHKNFASFCSLQALEDITTTGNAAVGQRRWTLEGGEKFAAEGKEWYMDYNLYVLEIEEADKTEALEILELMYYGVENIFTFEGEVRIETAENGVVTIVNGIEGETSVFSEFVLTPLENPIELNFPEVEGMTPPLTVESAQGYRNTYGSGIDYLRYIKKMFEDFAAENGTGATDE
jgi:hypothetical protein